MTVKEACDNLYNSIKNFTYDVSKSNDRYHESGDKLKKAINHFACAILSQVKNNKV